MEPYNEQLFEQLKPSHLVILLFTATWCGPCHIVHEAVEKLIPEYVGKKVKFLEINVDEQREVVAKFGIRNIPVLIFFQNGENKEKKLGALSQSQLKELIDKYLPV